MMNDNIVKKDAAEDEYEQLKKLLLEKSIVILDPDVQREKISKNLEVYKIKGENET